MKDIKLDFQNNKLVNEYIDGKDRAVQQIIVACRSWIGDFFLNNDFGIDYDNSWGDQDFMRMFIREQVSAINGVDSINKINIRQTKNVKNEVIFIVDIELVYNKELFTISDILIY